MSQVGTHRHPGVGLSVRQSSLAVAEKRPGMASRNAGKLHKMERQFRIVPELAPAGLEQGEEPLVEFYIVGIGFTLVPNDTAKRIVLQGCNTALEEVTRFIGMALQRILRLLDILSGPLACPFLRMVIL
ncbi:hypothetical protein EVA_02975 [gut metagenome]|uniref:Uncharacterized protein n=1 Tax=gut metagenome TaxID=749906 RepID=J9GLV7_9ZZZZ